MCNFAGGATVHQHIELRLALNTNEPGRGHQSRCIDPPLGRGIVEIAYRSNAVADNSDIADKPGSTRAINDTGSRDDKIVGSLLRVTHHAGDQQTNEGNQRR